MYLNHNNTKILLVVGNYKVHLYVHNHLNYVIKMDIVK